MAMRRAYVPTDANRVLFGTEYAVSQLRCTLLRDLTNTTRVSG